MNKSHFRFTFKPAVESQRALIHQWLQQDYISEWIHGKGLQNTLSGLEKFFQHQGKDLDRQTKITQHWICYDGEKPFAYLLTSNVFKNTADVRIFHRMLVFAVLDFLLNLISNLLCIARF